MTAGYRILDLTAEILDYASSLGLIGSALARATPIVRPRHRHRGCGAPSGCRCHVTQDGLRVPRRSGNVLCSELMPGPPVAQRSRWSD
jgi:hypothetical protein